MMFEILCLVADSLVSSREKKIVGAV